MNKKNLTVLAITLTLTTIACQAGFVPAKGDNPLQGGFQGPSARQIIHDVVSALNASDDAQVELTGHIISSIGHDDYIFRDATGDIKVEIDDDLWGGHTVTPETPVIIRGEVDKDWSEVTVDADSLQLAQ
ncbi:MAG: YgiW/YdeI family stress tolerance OB fold protein [Shewanella sp.]